MSKYVLNKVEGEKNRLSMAEKHFKNVKDFLLFENSIYGAMEKATKGSYSGVLWDYYEVQHLDDNGQLLNETFMMAFDGGEGLVPLVSAWCDEKTSWFAASWAMNIVLYNQIGHFFYNRGDERKAQLFFDGYYSLRDAAFADDNPFSEAERSAIFSFID